MRSLLFLMPILLILFQVDDAWAAQPKSHEAGNPVEISRTGEGTTLRTFDVDGNPVWQLDPSGTQSVSTYHPISRVAHDTTIRLHPGVGGVLTTSVESVYDEGLAPIETRVTSVESVYDEGLAPIETRVTGHNGESRRITTERDTVGRVTSTELREDEFSPAFIARTEYERNLIGWPTAVREATDINFTNSDATTFAYNARGQQIEVLDPSGERTSYAYSGFGELATRTLPHRSGPIDTYFYDGFGRIGRHVTAIGDTIGFDYDPRGDRLAAGDTAPPIRVDDGVIIEGHHRYIAGRLFGTEPSQVPGTRAAHRSGNPGGSWDAILLDHADWGNR